VTRGLTGDALSRRLGLAADLKRLRAYITLWIEQGDREMRAPLRWQFITPSKYFRPLTISACYRAQTSEEMSVDVMRSAVALELLHNVSLSQVTMSPRTRA
jgi:geranylgeranyl diphosphate synthase type I